MTGDSETGEGEAQGRGARRRARTRVDLLAAARKVFASRGYHEASIAEITELADVGVGTFYLHFHDKEEALTTLIEEGLREMREQVITAVAQRPPEQRLARFIHVFFQHAAARHDLFRIMLTGAGPGAHPQPFLAQERLAEGLTALLEAVNTQGQLAGYHLPLLARFITGMLNQSILWWTEHAEPTPDTMAEQVLRLLRQGLPAQLLLEEHT
jgi:AcrR family transcriptional regulator